MCEFKITADLCSCRDKNCKQKVTELGETDPNSRGHIKKVTSCYRTHKPMCMGYFVHNDETKEPLLVRYGMRADDANSKQNCKNARWIIENNSIGRFGACCQKCKDVCQWGGSPSSSSAVSDTEE